MSPNAPRAGGRVDDLASSLASARLAGGLAIDADGLATGEIELRAPRTSTTFRRSSSPSSPASLQAKATASAVDGRQSVAIVADSDRMSVADNRLEGLKVDMTVADLWGARGIGGIGEARPRGVRRPGKSQTSG